MGNQLCNRLARIIGAQQASPMACALSPARRLNVRILGRRDRSPLTLPFALSFESKDSRGRTLNLGKPLS